MLPVSFLFSEFESLEINKIEIQTVSVTFLWSHQNNGLLKGSKFPFKKLFRSSNNFIGRRQDVGCHWSNYQRCLRHKKNSIAFPLHIEKKIRAKIPSGFTLSLRTLFSKIKITFSEFWKCSSFFPCLKTKCVPVFFQYDCFMICWDALLRSRQKKGVSIRPFLGSQWIFFW